jgi:uncharacterized protein with HEPN domain
MKRNHKIYLEDIYESILILEEYTKEKTFDEFTKSIDLQDKIIRRLEIVGEAIKNLPLNFRNKFPDVPWKKYAGLRDVLIHHYFGIDYELTWNVITEDLPHLKKYLLLILEKFDPELF